MICLCLNKQLSNCTGLVIIVSFVIRISSETKRQCFPFTVNKAPCGPGAAVAGATVGAEIAADFFFNLFRLKLHLRDASTAAASHVYRGQDTVVNAADYTSKCLSGD